MHSFIPYLAEFAKTNIISRLVMIIIIIIILKKFSEEITN